MGECVQVLCKDYGILQWGLWHPGFWYLWAPGTTGSLKDNWNMKY
jgi:hypothetical protein